MRRLNLLVLILLVFIINIKAQENNNQDLFKGTLNIAVPLTEINTGKLNIPISLSYDASGNKVETLASNIGLGWNLFSGASITRIVRGIPDDYNRDDVDNMGLGWLFEINEGTRVVVTDEDFISIKPSVHCDMSEYINHYDPYVEDNVTNWKVLQVFEGFWLDTEPDQFIFSLPGKSGEFYFDKDGVIQSVNNWTLKFSYNLDANNNLSEFTITDENGLMYIFGVVDKRTVRIEKDGNIEFLYGGGNGYGGIPMSIGSLITTSNETWKLSRIKTPDGQEITYSYETEGYSIDTNLPKYKTGLDNEEENAYEVYEISVNSNRLSQISTTNYEINFIKGNERQDLPGAYTINGLEVYWKTPRKFIKGIKFEQSYFISPGVSTLDGKRLKLESIQEYSQSDENPPYKFYYNEEDRLPSRLSGEQDLWGYYNANGATSLIPEIHVYNDLSVSHDPYRAIPIPNYTGNEHYVVAGADRTPDIRVVNGKVETVMDALILEQIDYPEGGSIKFEFEPHEYLYNDEKYEGGGLRIRKTILKDGVTGNDRVREFTYNGQLNTSGRLITKPIFAYIYYSHGDATAEDRVYNDYLNDRNNYYQKYLRVTNINNSYFVGSPIVYGNAQIVESDIGNTNYTFEINSIFEEYSSSFKTIVQHNLINEWCDVKCTYTGEIFNCHFALPPSLQIGVDNFPFPRNESVTWNRGQLKKIERFDVLSNPVSETVFEFSTDFRYDEAINYIYGIKYSRTNHPTIERETGFCWNPFLALNLPVSADCEGGNPQFVYARYKVATGVAKKLSSKTEKIYNTGSTVDYIETTTNYLYNNFGQVSSVSAIVSNGLMEELRYKYPLDYWYEQLISEEPSFPDEVSYGGLLVKNIISEPIETISIKNGKVTGGSINKYKVIPSVSYLSQIGDSHKVLPSQSYKLELKNPIDTATFTESKIFMRTSMLKDSHYRLETQNDAYDDYGNLTQSHRLNDYHVSYKWGHNGQYPMAKAVNMEYSQIEANNALLNYLNYLERYTEINSTNRVDLQILNSSIRQVMPSDAQITTYTYEPLVGMTSQTGPTGITTYYEYDDFGRLTLTKDHDGNIVERNSYHYIGEPINGFELESATTWPVTINTYNGNRTVTLDVTVRNADPFDLTCNITCAIDGIPKDLSGLVNGSSTRTFATSWTFGPGAATTKQITITGDVEHSLSVNLPASSAPSPADLHFVSFVCSDIGSGNVRSTVTYSNSGDYTGSVNTICYVYKSNIGGIFDPGNISADWVLQTQGQIAVTIDAHSTNSNSMVFSLQNGYYAFMLKEGTTHLSSKQLTITSYTPPPTPSLSIGKSLNTAGDAYDVVATLSNANCEGVEVTVYFTTAQQIGDLVTPASVTLTAGNCNAYFTVTTGSVDGMIRATATGGSVGTIYSNTIDVPALDSGGGPL